MFTIIIIILEEKIQRPGRDSNPHPPTLVTSSLGQVRALRLTRWATELLLLTHAFSQCHRQLIDSRIHSFTAESDTQPAIYLIIIMKTIYIEPKNRMNGTLGASHIHYSFSRWFHTPFTTHSLAQSSFIQLFTQLVTYSSIIHPGTSHHSVTYPSTIHPATWHHSVINPSTIHPATSRHSITYPSTIHPATWHNYVTYPSTIQPSTMHPATSHHSVTYPSTIHPATSHHSVINPSTIHPTVYPATLISVFYLLSNVYCWL